MAISSPSLNIEVMRVAAAEATSVLRVLANPDRLLLLCQLSQGEKSVGELEGLVGIGQPTLSQQLGVLRNEGLVDTRREGKYIYYSVHDPKVLTLLRCLYQLYCPQKSTSHDD
ncbi:MAG: metalloregulator ArsR/SmtB family transcription factor [Candidatus Accumulibacter sp. UW20]|jgi:DNA-binding transcriptional ArsR family regulator